jgi:hypothetical protein
VGEERDAESGHRHPPRERLSPSQVAGDGEEGEAREEHQGTAALRDLEGKPALQLHEHDVGTREEGGDDVEQAHETHDERDDRVQVHRAQVAPREDPTRLAGREDEGGKSEGDHGQEELVVPQPGQEGRRRSREVVPQQGSGHRPEDAGEEVQGEEEPGGHAQGAARRGDEDAEAHREAADHEHPARMARHQLQELREAGARSEAVLQPGPATEPRELEVDLVGGAVGHDGHANHQGQEEEAPLGEEGAHEEEGLAFRHHAEEEEGIPVLEE